jgi:hypothetical protein
VTGAELLKPYAPFVPQGFPLYGAGLSGRRKGKVFAVVGWTLRHESAPSLGHVPVIVPINGGSVAEPYDTGDGIVRMFATADAARAAAGGAL